MEGSRSFCIVLLILLFVFLGVDCFGLQELFEGWEYIEIHQIKNSLSVYPESEHGYSHNALDLTFLAIFGWKRNIFVSFCVKSLF